jgi:hypothetical protein
MIARRRSEDGWDVGFGKPETARAKTQQFFSETTWFPGPDSLRLRKPLVQPADAFVMLDDLTASFIRSGPFKLGLTKIPSRHLTITKDGEILLFWEGKENFEERRGIPGDDTFRRYTTHTLGRFCPIALNNSDCCRALGAKDIYQEIVLSYALLFTRDEQSKKIAETLFEANGVHVQFLENVRSPGPM